MGSKKTLLIATAVASASLAAAAVLLMNTGAKTPLPTPAPAAPSALTNTAPPAAPPAQGGGEMDDLIKVSVPLRDAVVTSPLRVEGEARGNWYFEATFPIRLVDASGGEVAAGLGWAQGEWMTRDFVPFAATLEFAAPAAATGTLILHNDNPSGLPEYDKEIRIPVRFSSSPK